ncbi:plant cysteine oxidase 1 [Manihot esculenta]|uniref:Uncharacterized protein n=1 Tax=Manihot esculenta TaxID=3983 RepID=A0ACB7G034_MANES|nr:plant cysteine oxidase 1 [Manihot esculenta]KAG8632913.1 hypothetical protein MANES_18G065100v8 [Manihot esculenta]
MEMEVMSKVQRLYDACNHVFGQEELPTFLQIQSLKDLLDSFEAVDVGIDEFSSPGSPSSSPEGIRELICGQGVPEITYIHIHECDYFSIGIFCFPAGAIFPLHDHPRMTVLSKLLYGSVYVKAYDWVKLEKSCSRTIGLARNVEDGIRNAPSEPSILFPENGGNIHSFTALTPCAILDVLSPPYSEEFGRPSTYFSEFPIPALPGYTLLEEKDLPGDLVVIGAPYLGPPLSLYKCTNAKACIYT